MDMAIPQNVNEADEASAFASYHPTQAVPVHELRPDQLLLAEHPGAEGFGVEQVDLLIGKVAPPLIDHCHGANLASRRERQRRLGHRRSRQTILDRLRPLATSFKESII